MEIYLNEGSNDIDIEDDRYIITGSAFVEFEYTMTWEGDRECPPEYDADENITIHQLDVWDKLKEQYVELDIKWKVL
jgi:hypothetical protein